MLITNLSSESMGESTEFCSRAVKNRKLVKNDQWKFATKKKHVRQKKTPFSLWTKNMILSPFLTGIDPLGSLVMTRGSFSTQKCPKKPNIEAFGKRWSFSLKSEIVWFWPFSKADQNWRKRPRANLRPDLGTGGSVYPGRSWIWPYLQGLAQGKFLKNKKCQTGLRNFSPQK